MVTWHKPLKHTEAPRPILSRDCAGSVKATAPPGQSLGVRQKNTRCRGLMRGQRKEVHLLSFRGAQQAASFQMNLSSYVHCLVDLLGLGFAFDGAVAAFAFGQALSENHHLVLLIHVANDALALHRRLMEEGFR